MVVSFHYGEYYSGQFNAITGFFVLLGIYYFLKDKSHLGFLSWSVACIFKLTIVFLIFVFLIQKPLKKMLKNTLYVLIGQIPNLLMFLIWPQLLIDFLSMNFNKAFTPYSSLSTGTFSIFLEREFDFPIFPTTILMMVCLIPINIYIIRVRKESSTFLDRLMICFLLIISLIPNFWGIHVIYYLPVFLIWLATKHGSKREKIPRLILAIPSLFGSLWIFFQYFSIFYLFSLIFLDFLILSKNPSSFRASLEKLVL